MNITLKDVPDNLHRNLKQRAQQHGRSLNKEAVDILSEALTPQRREASSLLESIRARRDKMPSIVEEGKIDQIIDASRR
jgi:plasmid stability protein